MTNSTPRVVATDLDGTLLRSDGTVSERSRAALTRAEEAGATVVFVSGRPPRWIDVLADAVGEHGLAICANGALVYDVRQRAVIEEHGLPGDIAMQVAQAIRESVPGSVFAVERRLNFGHEPTYRGRWPAPQDTLVAELDELLAEPVSKLLAAHRELDAREFVDRAAAVVGSLAAATYSGSDAVLEISAAGVSKASTLATLCAELGVDAHDVVAFGDMPNDVPMLAWAGTSFAVAGAHPDAVAAATHRCGDNDDDGVAEVLERLFP
ncbi:Cof-type HAD-IIB family hydrolase [Jiangella gansuensis]|uniref:Cof-type HAD-IIB family hydrolase n=1 Tax=Jiangella gansuensis TaxID=281473 RepID=UPI00056192B0|nr:Cof-type HAD-IIB family hydrolase [Jiangella gansuensis]